LGLLELVEELSGGAEDVVAVLHLTNDAAVVALQFVDDGFGLS
jgi:hypothetical protein